MPLPSRFDGPLDDVLTQPNCALATDLAAVDGDIVVLGVPGQAAAIDRVCRSHAELSDDAFVSANLER